MQDFNTDDIFLIHFQAPLPKKNLSLQTDEDDISSLSKSDSENSTEQVTKGKRSRTKTAKEKSGTADVVRRRSTRKTRNK